MTISLSQIEQWKSEFISGEKTVPLYCKYELDDHLDKLQLEFTGSPRLCFELGALIVRIRREVDLEESVEKFHFLIKTEIDFFCAELNSRWLVSVADTIADYGLPEERLGAMISVVMMNTIKLSETERGLMRDITLCDQKFEHNKKGPAPLWDGMASYVIDCGDTPRNTLSRCQRVLSLAPVSAKIFNELMQRLQNNPNLLNRLAQYNPRFWK